MPEFVLRTNHLCGAMEEVAKDHGHSGDEARAVLRLLPDPVKRAPAFYLLTRAWHYGYGVPFNNLPNGTVVTGTPQLPQVKWLYLGLRAFQGRVSAAKLLAYLERLAVREKHQDALAELAPLLRSPGSASMDHEVVGFGEGNRTIDFRFEPAEGSPILLDVKYRVKDVLDRLKQFIPKVDAGEDLLGLAPPSPEALFKDTVEKFNPNDPTDQLQGVWIHPHIKQPRTALNTYFDQLDAARLHFAVLAKWEPAAYVLARTSAIEQTVQSFFGLEESDEFVTTNNVEEAT